MKKLLLTSLILLLGTTSIIMPSSASNNDVNIPVTFKAGDASANTVGINYLTAGNWTTMQPLFTDNATVSTILLPRGTTLGFYYGLHYETASGFVTSWAGIVNAPTPQISNGATFTISNCGIKNQAYTCLVSQP